ncbi:MAG: DUF1697 domain-containing protein [Rhodothermaceae bacterium]
MEKYIAILRGINVSGKNKIKMAELKLMFEQAGFKNVVTYIQSGNIIFEHKKSDVVTLQKSIETEIKKTFDLDVPALVLEKKTLSKIFSNNPFLTKRSEDINFLHATILENIPEKSLVSKIENFESGSDEFIVEKNVIYVFCPNGYGRTKLTNIFFENKLKTKATTRNWKTVTKLIELSE